MSLVDEAVSVDPAKVALATAGVVALYVVQLNNFLLFHGLVEIFSILVAFAVFVVTWNARDELESAFLGLLGISYLFIGGVDLLHTLAYKGMGVFPGYGADLPTQLWIFGRYLEAFSLLGAGLLGFRPEFLRETGSGLRERVIYGVAAVYLVVTAVGLGSIFVLDVFPAAFGEGSGLTPFKVYSEYVIIGLFAVSLYLLHRQRESFDREVFSYIVVAIVLTWFSEFAFTFYVDVYGLSNAVGHFFKIGSFYLVYLAVVKTGIREPQKTLYRKLAERESEARKFKQAVEHSGHSVVITNSEGRIQYVNPAYEETTGYVREEVVGENPSILKSGVHGEEFYQELWETIKSGEVWNSEFVNETKEGDRFVVNQTIAPVTDEEGNIQHFVGIHGDITEQKKQERDLLQRYESLFDSIRDAIVVTDTEHRITNANPAFTDLFGYGFDEVEGRETRMLYENLEQFERIDSEIDEHLEDSGKAGRFTQTVNYEKKTGQVFPGETTFFFLRDSEGETVGFIKLIRDVSDREDRIHQMEVLDRVLRHNLRNEMNVIKGSAKVLEEECPEELRGEAGDIVETSDQLLERVGKEREITKLLSGTGAPERMEFRSTLERMIEELRERYPDAEVSLSIPEGEEVRLRAIPSISQAVEEVIENAIEHSDRGSPEVEVGVEVSGETVEIRVADDGPGIPGMEQRVLTKEMEISPLFHGSGLGLWLVNLIVRQSGGVLEFEDNEPRGSVVKIRLRAG